MKHNTCIVCIVLYMINNSDSNGISHAGTSLPLSFSLIESLSLSAELTLSSV